MNTKTKRITVRIEEDIYIYFLDKSKKIGFKSINEYIAVLVRRHYENPELEIRLQGLSIAMLEQLGRDLVGKK